MWKNNTTSSSSVSSASSTSASSASDASSAGSTSSDSTASEEYASPSDVDGIPVVDEEVDPAECVTLGDYKKLTLEKKVEQVTDDDVQTAIMAETAVTMDDPDATVQKGDTADIAYVGKVDGKEFDGGSSDSYNLVIGSGTFIDGFEDGVIGMKTGETKDLNLKFPDSYQSTDLAGKDVVFTVTVNAFTRPAENIDGWELDDAWVAKIQITVLWRNTVPENAQSWRLQMRRQRKIICRMTRCSRWQTAVRFTKFRNPISPLAKRITINGIPLIFRITAFPWTTIWSSMRTEQPTIRRKQRMQERWQKCPSSGCRKRGRRLDYR